MVIFATINSNLQGRAEMSNYTKTEMLEILDKVKDEIAANIQSGILSDLRDVLQQLEAEDSNKPNE